MNRYISLLAMAVIVLLLAGMAVAETPNRVTILYDSFGKNPALTMDWGFAALVEYGGKRILFDTGNNARSLEHNVKAAGVDFRNIDFAIISHRHADHTSGITYVLTVNPKVPIYVPDEPWGLFARGVKNDFYRKDPRCAPRCAIMAAIRRRSWKPARLGRPRISSLSTKEPKWRREYLSSLASPQLPARWS